MGEGQPRLRPVQAKKRYAWGGYLSDGMSGYSLAGTVNTCPG